MEPRFVLMFPLVCALATACGLDHRFRGLCRPNVILLSIDSLRPDHLGCYGYQRQTSPHLDAFSREAVLFRMAIAQAPSTLPSHASMFTSLHPPRHGASFARRSALPEGVWTLAKELRNHGYRTAAFYASGQLAPEFGTGQGFDTYTVTPAALWHQVLAAEEWIQREDKRFFLFLHTNEVHHPYQPPPDVLELFENDYEGPLPNAITPELLKKINRGEAALTEADARHIVATYDASIRSADRSFGHLIRFLKSDGLYDRTLIVVTSDHGEEFGEHGVWGWHSHTLYDELLMVPLIVRFPKGAHAGSIVHQQVRLIDIAPTVLEVARVARPSHLEGRSLLEVVRDPHAPSRVAYSELDATGERRAALRTPRWKLNGSALFDLHADPRETRDVSSVFTDTSAELMRQRDALVGGPTAPPGPSVDLDEETREALRALGYLE